MARSTTSKKTKKAATRRVRRINWKGLAILGGLLVAVLISYFPLKYGTTRRIRDSALAQARASGEKGDVELAIRHLDRFLADNPEDKEALKERATLVTKASRSGPQLLDAATTIDRYLRTPLGEDKDPKARERELEDRREMRRKLAEIYIRYSDDLKRFTDFVNDPDGERRQVRYVAATALAGQLIEEAGGKKDRNNKLTKSSDAVAHRLYAMALEGQLADLGSKVMDNSESLGDLVRHYGYALEINPRDQVSSERLAGIYLTRLKDARRSEEILDAMLKADEKSVEVRMARFGAFMRAKKEDRAKAELDAALALAPENVGLRLQAASFALGRRDAAEARRQLDAIPAGQQNELMVKVARGQLEFFEQHPDQAIDQWRRGLSLVGGGDQMLTWQLAFNLIQLGRLSEADPLVKQFNRLAGADKQKHGSFLVGVYEYASGHYNEATAIFEKIRESVAAALKADVLLYLGRCYETKGETANAEAAFRNAATAAPSSAGPRLELARLMQRRRPDQAVSEVERALADSPDDLNLLLQAIRLRVARLATLAPGRQQQQWGELDALIKRAEKVAPDNLMLRGYRAEFMAATGKLAEAVEMLGQSAQGADRKRPEAWITWATGLARLNRRDDAVAALDRAALPENAGDRASLRVAKARFCVLAGKGQAAREAVSANLENVPEGDRAELARARAVLLHELGDREGCRAAYLEWARLAPQSPQPGLALLDLAQLDNDEKAAKLGLECLQAIGGANEPYGMAARAFELLRLDPNRPGPPSSDRLDEADSLVRVLRKEAPQLRIGYLLQGMVLEYRGQLEDALKSYQAACKDDPISSALPRLIEAYMKLKRYDDLDRLKREVEQEAASRQQASLSTEFDRIATLVALKLGDKDRADYFASQMSGGPSNPVQSRAAYARILDANGKPEQAEKALEELVDQRPNDPIAWLTLIAFEALRKTPADVARTIEVARKRYKAERPELFLAQCYWIGNDLPNAKTAYQKAVALKPDDMVTLRSQVEFYQSTNQGDLIEPVLRKILKLDPAASWAARLLADRLSARSDPGAWPEAWALVAPGSPASGDTPEDRLMRATVLARSPESARRAEAVAAFSSLANDLPISSPLAVDCRLRLAQAMIETKRFADAWEDIRPIADDTTRPNANALVLAIEALARSGRPDEAERRLERLALIEPNSPQLALSKGWVMLARGKQEEAASSVEGAYTSSSASNAPNAGGVGLITIDLLLKIGDLDAALRVAESVAKRWPRDAWALARVLVARKEYDKALAASRIAFENDSPREALRYAMAAAVARRTDPAFVKQVVDLGEAVKAKAPRDFEILIFLATIRHLQGRYEEELNFYRQAKELNPSNVSFLNNMAWSLCEGLHRPEEALKQIDEAIRREGRAPQYLDTRGVILGRLGKHKQAIADLEQSAKDEPSATTYFHLARAYLQANNAAESRRCRDLAIEAKFDPESLDPTDRADLSAVMGKP